jgi:hypothetical protein
MSWCFTASLSFNVIIMSTAKYSANLCVGTYILGWWWWFSTTMLWCEVEKKTKNPRNVWCTWWHLHKGIYTLTKRQHEANIFLPFTIILNQQLQKLNTDLILCSRLDHIIILCLASSS